MPEEISKWAGSLSMFRIWSLASYSLNSFKRGYIGGYVGDYIGTTIGVIEGDTGTSAQKVGCR